MTMLSRVQVHCVGHVDHVELVDQGDNVDHDHVEQVGLVKAPHSFLFVLEQGNKECLVVSL